MPSCGDSCDEVSEEGRALLAAAERFYDSRSGNEFNEVTHRTLAKKIRDAVTSLERTRDPYAARAHLLQAQSLRYLPHQRATVLDLIRKALAVDPALMAAWDVYVDMSAWLPSVSGLIGVWNEMPGNVQERFAPTFLSIAWQQDRHGHLPTRDTQPLIDALLGAARANPDPRGRAVLCAELGARAYRAGDADSGFAYATEAIAAKSRDTRVIDKASVTLVKAGKYAEAGAAIRQALSGVPTPAVRARLEKRLARCEKALATGRAHGPDDTSRSERRSAH